MLEIELKPYVDLTPAASPAAARRSAAKRRGEWLALAADCLARSAAATDERVARIEAAAAEIAQYEARKVG